MEYSPKKYFDQLPRDRINPYLIAAKIFLQRLLWDLHPYSWRSRNKFIAYKNIYYGKKAVILCNGPSLNNVDFDFLSKSNIFTIGLNKINLLFDRSTFRPSIIVAVNPLVIKQNKTFYNSTDIPLFIDYRGRKWIEFRSNIYFIHSTESHNYFARDCSISINQGGTVTFVALQIAFHLGFFDVGLVGCDHYFTTKGPPNKIVTAGKKDLNHFDTQYFSSGSEWHLPDLKLSELHYERARNMFNHYGRSIVNCTEGGHLEIFERKSLAQFIAQ